MKVAPIFIKAHSSSHRILFPNQLHVAVEPLGGLDADCDRSNNIQTLVYARCNWFFVQTVIRLLVN